MAQLRTFLNSLRLTYPSLLISRGFLFMSECVLCNGKVRARGYCAKHYAKLMTYGDPLHGKTYEKHGMKGSAEYNCWFSMKKRCYNEKEQNYKYYGARGVTVCDRWRNSFLAFYEDMGKRPSKNHSLDRIDVNGNYEPSNCRWADQVTQNRNQRLRIDNYSGVKGVSFSKSKNKWHARISVNKSEIHLGYYDTLKDAILARKRAELKYWNG